MNLSSGAFGLHARVDIYVNTLNSPFMLTPTRRQLLYCSEKGALLELYRRAAENEVRNQGAA